jgi:predicted membrane channel-forming protein YqfA (hemolysin III family)
MFSLFGSVSISTETTIADELTRFSFHVFENHSLSLSRYCNKLDYVGIVVLMWGAAISTIYFGFPCDPKLRLFYWMTVCWLLPTSLLSSVNVTLDHAHCNVLRHR